MSTQPQHQVHRAGWLRTRAPWVVIGIFLVSGIGSAAYAFWQSISSSNFAAAAGDAVMAGSKPSASIKGADITVSWAAGSTTGGRPVTGYTVTRYDAASNGAKTQATGACGGTVTVLSCAERNVPGGTWYYTVTPAISLWEGPESPRSDGVTADSTPPVASVASISPTPNASGFNNSSPITVNLTAQDNTGGSGVASITYAIDSGSPTTVDAANAAVSVSGDGTHVVSYFATDNAGNASASQNLGIKIDTVAPGTPSVSVPGYVNSANVANVPVSGTAEPGSTVTLTVTDAGLAHTVSQTVTANGAGAWTATGLNLAALNDGTVAYTAKATDPAGNTGSTVTVTSVKDTVAPAAPTISAPAYLNKANVANVPVSGTAEAGAAVTLIVADAGAAHSISQAMTADGTGAWSTTGLNLTSLDEGAVTYTATTTDAAGNTGTSAALTRTKDTLAPEPPTLSVPLFVYTANVANLSVKGTTEAGATVTLTATDPGTAHTVSKDATPDGTGAWTTGLDLSSLNQGTVTYKATATDAAGNASAIATTTNTKDTISATPVITAPAVSANNVGSVLVNGTSDAGASVTLTVTDAGSVHSISPKVTATSSGTWSTTLDLSAFADGTINYSATGTDPAGNVSAAGTANNTKEALAPSVTGVQLNDGPASNGGKGKIGPGDFVTLTFSEALSASTICSGWTDNTTTQTQNADNLVTVSVSATNVLTVSSSSGCALNVGTVALSGSYYGSGTLTYKGAGGNASALQWNPNNRTLTITLGALASGSPSNGAQSAAPASYTPASGLTDIAGKGLATTTVAGAASRF